MEYRIHPRTGDKISVIGIGTGPIFETTEREAAAALTYACEQGVNYLDFATAGARTFPYAGAALADLRKELLYQIHFGADYTSGEYGWSLDLDTVKRQVDWQLKELKTDYIDFGMIHCLDEERDWRAYQKNGVLDYLLEMKKSGVVRHIGLSTHTPELAGRILDSGIVEQMMFSIPTGGARMSRGGSSADQRADYYLQMPVIMAAINMSSDPVFLTRVVVVYTQKDLQRRNVGDYIADKFTDVQIQRIRTGITTGMISHLPELCRRMLDLRGRLAKVETSTKVTSRYVNSLLPALVVYDFLGFDAAGMFRCMVDNNRALLESLNFQDFQSEILNAVLYSEGVKTMLDDNIAGFSSPKALIMSGDFHILNNSGCGVKILPEKKWIVIFWRDAKQTLLRTTIYRNMSERSVTWCAREQMWHAKTQTSPNMNCKRTLNRHSRKTNTT